MIDVGGRREVELIKIHALATGVRVADGLVERLGGADALTIHEYATTGGITLELGDGLYINAPFDEPFSPTSALELTDESGLLELHLDGGPRAAVVGIVPLPGYLEVSDSTGRLAADVVMSHVDRLRVSPIVGCAYDCSFCDLGEMRYRTRPVEQLLAAIDIGLADHRLPVRHLLISGGSPGAAPSQQRYFEDVCVAIAQHAAQRAPAAGGPVEVDIMMSARPDAEAFVPRVVEAGVTGFSFNVEVFSREGAARHLPRKQRFAQPHLERSIRTAVGHLGAGSGRVRSLVIVGLEPTAATLEAVEWLSSLGCDPVLSPFRPTRGTRAGNLPPCDPEELEGVLHDARSIVAKHGVALGPRCVPCQHNTLSFPWDSAAA